MSDPGFDIPASFWESLTSEEFTVLCETSTLNADQCKRLWEHMGRPDEPPISCQIVVNRDDVLRQWPEVKPS